MSRMNRSGCSVAGVHSAGGRIGGGPPGGRAQGQVLQTPRRFIAMVLSIARLTSAGRQAPSSPSYWPGSSAARSERPAIIAAIYCIEVRRSSLQTRQVPPRCAQLKCNPSPLATPRHPCARLICCCPGYAGVVMRLSAVLAGEAAAPRAAGGPLSSVLADLGAHSDSGGGGGAGGAPLDDMLAAVDSDTFTAAHLAVAGESMQQLSSKLWSDQQYPPHLPAVHRHLAEERQRWERQQLVVSRLPDGGHKAKLRIARLERYIALREAEEAQAQEQQPAQQHEQDQQQQQHKAGRLNKWLATAIDNAAAYAAEQQRQQQQQQPWQQPWQQQPTFQLRPADIPPGSSRDFSGLNDAAPGPPANVRGGGVGDACRPTKSLAGVRAKQADGRV